jgi:hypothetical protein
MVLSTQELLMLELCARNMKSGGCEARDEEKHRETRKVRG